MLSLIDKWDYINYWSYLKFIWMSEYDINACGLNITKSRKENIILIKLLE